MRRLPGRIPLVIFAALVLHAGAARAEARIEGVEPARDDSMLTCVIRTSGLPDAPSLETLASGLPSSITLSLVLLDDSGHPRGGTRSEIRIEPDPYERGYRVHGPAFVRRAPDLEALRALLRRLGPVPVMRLSALDVARAPRIRVRMSLHALAPAEVAEAHALFSGDMAGNGADRREVSAGVGSLLRFFLGRTPDAQRGLEGVSPAFDARTLPKGP